MGIKHLSEPGAVSRTLFSRAGHFCQAVEPLSTVLRFLTLSHRQPRPMCPACVTQEEPLGTKGDNLRPEAPVQCLAPGRREEETSVWVGGTGEALKALQRSEVQRGAQMATSPQSKAPDSRCLDLR